MAKVTIIQADHSRVELDVPPGVSIMRAAGDSGVEGIIGECGGGMTCATCHVVVETKQMLDRIAEMSPTEDQMLDFTAMQREPESRLSCQIVMSEELDGLVVRVADPQI
ncbi:2Fe-2S iron-sulfur cluster-binding protein [Pseudochelatococcus sp. B33]